MKKNLIIFLVAAILIVAGWAVLQSGESDPQQNENQNKEQDQIYSLEGSKRLARDWMKNECPTYTYDGEDLSLKEAKTLDKNDCQDCYEFTFTFKSRHGGFGDREGQMVTQAITPHITTVNVEHGEVEQAITDNEFNEITEEAIQGGQGVDRLQPQTVDLYYYNQQEDTDEGGNVMCSESSVLPVERIIPAQNEIKETINLLLEGKLTEEEESQGFDTEFPDPEFKLEEMELDENTGELTLTFSEVPGFTSGGSCRVELLKAQIEKTALQFPEVEKVVIMPETIFQP
ncbi:MAG: GerMN domain-containing protein [Patescibacteria group bacterium]